MDIAIISIDKQSNILEYSDAINPIYFIRDNNLNVFETNIMPIGIHYNISECFTSNFIKLQKGDMIYLFTDGYIDQFGGKYNQKFKIRNFKNLLIKINSLPLNE
ncbi:MAG: SpoIIE family protein phosphatase [Bacteroidales bacterium]|nr:SpoIIE family protein phosphatase [Bacteroidales bacterium]